MSKIYSKRLMVVVRSFRHTNRMGHVTNNIKHILRDFGLKIKLISFFTHVYLFSNPRGWVQSIHFTWSFSKLVNDAFHKAKKNTHQPKLSAILLVDWTAAMTTCKFIFLHQHSLSTFSENWLYSLRKIFLKTIYYRIKGLEP